MVLANLVVLTTLSGSLIRWHLLDGIYHSNWEEIVTRYLFA